MANNAENLEMLIKLETLITAFNKYLEEESNFSPEKKKDIFSAYVGLAIGRVYGTAPPIDFANAIDSNLKKYNIDKKFTAPVTLVLEALEFLDKYCEVYESLNINVVF